MERKHQVKSSQKIPELGYSLCPRCHGDGQVFACTSVTSPFGGSIGEYFQCPVCDGMGDVKTSDLISNDIDELLN